MVASKRAPKIVRLVVVAVTVRKFVEEPFVAKKLVIVALVALKLTTVPDAEVRSEIVPLVMVVVARLEVEVAVRVPVTRLEVVAFVAIRLVKNPVTAVKRLVKRLVDVALVRVALVAVKVPVMFALPDAEILVVDALPRVV